MKINLVNDDNDDDDDDPSFRELDFNSFSVQSVARKMCLIPDF